MAFQLAQAYVEFGAKGVSTVLGAVANIHRRVMALINPFNLLKTTIGKLTAVGAALGVAFSARGIAQAFAKQEQAEMRLRGALTANGRAVEVLMADYKQFASDLQSVTVVGDETTLEMLQMAESLGLTGDAAKTAIKEAIGLGRALGMSEKSAIRYTAALASGDTTMLNRYMPTLRKIENQSERVAAAHAMLGKMFGVAEDEAKSNTGALQQMRNAIGDVMEKIGAEWAEVFDFRGTTQRIKEFAETFWQDYGARIHNAFVVIREAGRIAWEGIQTGFRAAYNYIADLLKPFQENFQGAFGTITGYLDVMLGSWEGFQQGIVQATHALMPQLKLIWEGFRSWLTKLWYDIEAMIGEVSAKIIEQMPGGEKMAEDARKRISLRHSMLSMGENIRHAVLAAGLEKEAGSAAEAAREWLENNKLPRVSQNFKTPAEMARAGAPGGAGGGAFPGGPGGAFAGGRMVSFAGLADMMQQQAAQRLRERMANATERTADATERMANWISPGDLTPNDIGPGMRPVGSIGG